MGILKKRKMTEKNDILASRCVVLVPLDRADAAQHAALKFNLQPSVEHEPSLAMAEICLHVQHLRINQAWCATQDAAHLLLVHVQDLAGVDQLIAALQKYLPSVKISELRDGQIQGVQNRGAVVDSLTELPIVQSKEIDADELSMLLDNNPQEAKE